MEASRASHGRRSARGELHKGAGGAFVCYIAYMRIVRRHILALLVALLLVALLLVAAAGCSSSGSGSGKAEVPIPVQRGTVAELAATMTEAIRHRQHSTIMALYTEGSAAAVKRSINSGLGTAGSIDYLFLLEFEEDGEGEEQAVEVVGHFGARLELRLPSGRRVNATVIQENGGWAIDVIGSAGGEILLLTD